MQALKEFVRKSFSTLYWKISAIFLLLLIILGSLYTYITATSAEMYFQEASQKLNRSIAKHIANDIKPFVNGKVNHKVLEETFHYIMILNPSIEVYLLDTQGQILSYYAPDSKIVLKKVSLGPIRQFINDTEEKFIVGDDPKNPHIHKVFSAASIDDNGKQIGYIYIVLASQEYDSIANFLLGSYRLRLAIKMITTTLISALIIGLFAIWYITRNLNKIIQTVKQFQQGDLSARVTLKSKGELTQLAETFNEMADTIVSNIDELKSVEKLRRELIANVSHDLRTPLTAIQGYAETLIMKTDSLNEQERLEYTDVILQGTKELKKMVDELFELSKLETQQIEVNLESFSLSELVHDIVQKYMLLAKKQNVHIETKIPQDLPPIYADLALIDRVLQNLIDNALKFTPNGGTVAIELKQAQNGLEVTVSDTGLGIPEEELPYIFDRYRRGRKVKTDGVGLGLTIVQKILEIHNATISVRSKLNQGTTFYFVLPATT